MKSFAVVTLGAVLAAGGLATARALPSGPYQGQGQGRGRGHEIDRNSAAYQEGYNQGRDDARSGRSSNNSSSRWHARHDRDAYAAGYAQGYREGHGNSDRRATRDRDRDHDRDQDRDHDRASRPERGQSGRIGAGGVSGSAEQIGYQDGLNDGAKDRQTGHSFRPTQGDNYKNATRGYNSSMGSKDQYKSVYREGYASGYQRGYNGR